jgi:phage gp46-like protein
MDSLQIRAAEGCAADSNVLWDSIWDAERGLADWGLASAAETSNRGGLRATAILETAVTLALFTNKRVPSDHPLAWLADGDPQGYWGDGVDVRADLGEAELGSLLWLLERAPVTINGVSVAIWAQQFASEALKPLLDQKAVVKVDVSASVEEIRGKLLLFVNLYGRDGQRIYDRKFDLVWNQVA